MKTNVYTMAILYCDDGTSEKKTFTRKDTAIEWIKKISAENRRPVTITFYSGNVPNWVFTQE